MMNEVALLFQCISWKLLATLLAQYMHLFPWCPHPACLH